VLDDDKDDLFLICRTLTNARITEVKSFTSVTPFLRAIEINAMRNCADTIIIDFNLNGAQNGIDIIRQIQQKSWYTYFIMLSGDNSFETIYEFNNTVHMGQYILKGLPDTNARILKCLHERFDYLETVKATSSFLNKKRKESRKRRID
jgi:DNA-binding NtrC family response regulator